MLSNELELVDSTEKKIRILTFHFIKNYGAFLHTYSLSELLQSFLQTYEVNILNYKHPKLLFYESFKIAKSMFEEFSYLNRYKIFNSAIEKHLSLDRDLPNIFCKSKLIEHLNNKSFELLVVSMDVWRLDNKFNLPGFPNIYWLSEKIQSKKIAFAVSAYDSDSGMIVNNRDKLITLLDSFDLIGARDSYTYNFVAKIKGNEKNLERVYDPTIHYKIKQTNVKLKLQKAGVNFNLPILGLLVYGNDTVSKKMREYYKSLGYQIVAISMYNRFADINLGDALNPFEWAESFCFFNMCITDRFHGALFCIKNNTPFICIEPSHIELTKSKLYCLLKDYDLLECYGNAFIVDDKCQQFLSKCKEIENFWNCLSKNLECKTRQMINENYKFMSKVSDIID